MQLLLMFLLFGSMTPKQAVKQIHKAISADTFAGTHFGISIYAPMRGRSIMNHQAFHNFRPASNTKILTTMLAFEHLGTDYQFSTSIAIDGPLEDGILKGNLIILAGGDPSISGNYSKNTYHSRDVMNSFAQTILDLGIREIQGSIIANMDRFPDTPLVDSWEWSDLIYYYGVPPTGLSVHDGWIEFRFEVDENKQLSWNMWPQHIPDFSMDIKVTHSNDEAWTKLERTFGRNHFHFSGNLPACTNYHYIQAAWKPQEAFTYALRDALTALGVTVHWKKLEQSQDSQILDTWHSAPISELAQTLMIYSQNYYADIFWRITAAEALGDSSMNGAIPLADELIKESALSPQSMSGHQNRDGSGLSAQNNLKPNQLVSLLNHALEQPYRNAFLKTLPRIGQQGTVSEREVPFNAIAKTGYINRTRTLSGYLQTVAGELLIFSIMANNYACPTREIDELQNSILSTLSNLRMPRKLRNHPYYRTLADP